MLEKLSKKTQIAMKAALRAGALIKKQFGQKHEINHKSDYHDVVTEVDQASEDLIIRTIAEEFPSDCFLAEENGLIEGEDERRIWIVDPLDGTLNYSRNIPNYAVAIAAWEDYHLSVGVIYLPFLDELYVAERGKGAYLSGERITAGKTSRLDQALCSVGIKHRIHLREDDIIDYTQKLFKKGIAIRRGGCTSVDLAYVASGKIDAYIEPNMNTWDYAAGALIIKEAGGKCLFLGDDKLHLFKKQTLIACAPPLQEPLLEIFNPRKYYDYD